MQNPEGALNKGDSVRVKPSDLPPRVTGSSLLGQAHGMGL